MPSCAGSAPMAPASCLRLWPRDCREHDSRPDRLLHELCDSHRVSILERPTSIQNQPRAAKNATARSRSDRRQARDEGSTDWSCQTYLDWTFIQDQLDRRLDEGHAARWLYR